MQQFVIPEQGKIVNLIPADAISSAAMSTAYVCMKNYRHVDFILHFKSCSSIASDKVTVKQAVNAAGSSAANLVVKGYWSNKAALGSSSVANDQLAWTPVGSMSSSGAAFKLKSNSVSNQIYVVPVDAQELTNASSLDWAGIGVATIGKCDGGVIAILSGCRYMSDNPPTALA